VRSPEFFAVHTYTRGPPLSWGEFLEGIKDECTFLISEKAEAWSNDNLESVIGLQLYWGQHAKDCRNPCQPPVIFLSLSVNSSLGCSSTGGSTPRTAATRASPGNIPLMFVIEYMY
jgi:hypothetical protein